MAQRRSGPIEPQEGDNSLLQIDGAASAVQFHQVEGSAPVPSDVMAITGPLLLNLAEILGDVPVALVLPASSVPPSLSADGPMAICAASGARIDGGWGDLVLRVADDARNAVAGGDPAGVTFSPGQADDGGMTTGEIVAWPVTSGDDHTGVLLAAIGGIPRERLSPGRAFAGAISAALGVLAAQRRRAQASSALLEVARTAGSTLELDEVLALVTERMARWVEADRCGVWLLEKDGRTLVPSALHGMPPDYVQSKWKQYRTSLENEPLSMEAIETGTPVLVPDAPSDPRTDKDAVHFFEDKTILVLPMIARGQVQGTLFINHIRHHHDYSPGEIETALAIAGQAAIAIQNARLYREVQDWSNQLERLQEIMSKLSRSRSVSSIASVVADELRNLVRYDNCTVFILEEDSNELVPLAVVSSNPSYSADQLTDIRLPVGQGITGYVAATGKPQIVGDVERDPRSYHVPNSPVLDESMIATPVIFEGRVIGVITVWRLGINRFTEADLRLLDIFADEAAIEFENARLYQETQRKSRELLASLHRIGVALATGLDPNQTLQIVVDLAAEMVRARACSILLVNPDNGDLLIRAARGLPPEVVEVDEASYAHRFSRRVVDAGQPALINDINAEGRPLWMMQGWAEDLNSYMGVPLVLQGKTIGVLAVFGNRSFQFSQADLDLLSSFGHQAAIAIRNAQLFTSLQERVHDLSGLAEISHSVATLTNLEETYRELTRSIVQLLQAESCVLFLAGEGHELVPQQPAFGAGPEDLSDLKLRFEEEGGADVDGQCLVQSVDGQRVICEGHWLKQPSLVAPMRAQDQFVGAVLVVGRPGTRFSENETRLMKILAANAAVIVQNAILYQSMERERNELDAVISYSSDAIIVVDPENRVARINAATEALIGSRSDEVVGRPCEEVIYPRFAASPSGPGLSLQEVVGKRETIPYFEVVVVTKEGLERDVAASYSFVRLDSPGEGLGVIIARDISKQREVDRMKSDFVSMVSHELRTPLGLIKGYASTLLNPQLNLEESTAKRFLMGIDGAADRLNRLIENILSASRIESGHFRLSMQEVDMVTLVSQAVTAARATAKGREIILNAPRDPLVVDGDRVQLELVMDNLLGNAIKYSPLGKPIWVSMEGKEDEVEVRVVDQGIGIASHNLSKVFGRFYRVEGPHSVRTPGSGLGLYICRNIVEAHNGEIWVESRLGSGSTFAFRIPMRQPLKGEPEKAGGPVLHPVSREVSGNE